MTWITPLTLLLAQADPAGSGEASPGLTRLNQISENLSSEGLISTHWLMVAAGLVMLLISGMSIAQWWKHRHEHSHPWLVFSSTARFAGLGMRHQWTLFWIARHQRLGSPLALMLSPGTFDQHVKAYLDTRPGWRREGLRRKSQEIRECLYSDLVGADLGSDVNRQAA